MTWGWESFPEYLDALERMPHALDVGTQVAARRRARLRDGRARREERAGDARRHRAMAAIVREAIAAGALGFSTSRTIVHRAVDGEPVPGTFAAEDELFGDRPRAAASSAAGLFELAPAGAMGEDLAAPEKEVAWMRRLSRRDRPPGHASRSRSTTSTRTSAARCCALVARPNAARRAARAAGRLAPDDAPDRAPDLPPVLVQADLPGARDAAARRARREAARSRDPRRILAEESAFDDPRIAVVISMIENGLAQDLPARRPARLRARRPRRASPRSPRARAATRSRCSTTSCSSSTAAQLLDARDPLLQRRRPRGAARDARAPGAAPSASATAARTAARSATRA